MIIIAARCRTRVEKKARVELGIAESQLLTDVMMNNVNQSFDSSFSGLVADDLSAVRTQ